MPGHTEVIRDGAPTFFAEMSSDGVISLVVGGRVTNDKLVQFNEWMVKVKKLIADASKINGNRPVLVITDATGIVHFEHKPIVLLRELLDYDRQFNMKSAIVGTNPNLSALLRAVFEFTGRKNIRLFSGREEALRWLFSNETEVL